MSEDRVSQLVSGFVADRAALLAEHVAGNGTISELSSALATLTERWLIELFDAVTENDAGKGRTGVALVAIGGLGRAELSPGSDIDLLLCHADDVDTGDLADRIWYPVWDSKLKLGHAVRSIDASIELASRDIDTCTGLTDARHIAGDASVTAALTERIQQLWRDNADAQLEQLHKAVLRNQRGNGEVAYLLEPDLKLGRGGLRDIHAISWATAAGCCLNASDGERLAEAHRLLNDARVALHLLTGHSSDTLVIEEQDPVAELLGYGDADELMEDVSRAAREVAFISDEFWRTILASTDSATGSATGIPTVSPTGSATAHAPTVDEQIAGLLGRGVELDANQVVIDPTVDGAGDDPLLVLRAAAVAAAVELPLARASLDYCAQHPPELGEVWPPQARELLVTLLSSGPGAVDVIEALDFVGVWGTLIPEWLPCRNKPQRSRYHRFTVDRHLMEAAAQAGSKVDDVARGDLLVVAALLHDIGKGYPGNHSVVGTGLAPPIMRRWGFSDEDAAVVAKLITHHLLLTDVATRRDLHDPLTIRGVAEAVETEEFLRLLRALVEADCIATGPMAWSEWIANLVDTLVEFVADHLTGEPATALDADAARAPLGAEPVSRDIAERLASDGGTHVVGEGDTLTIVTVDAPGTFSRAAGALALRGLEVREAEAYSSPLGTHGTPPSATAAVSAFKVAPPDTPIDWPRIAHDVKLALSGELALRARIAQRAQLYRRRQALAAQTAETTVSFDTAATDATIVEVRTEDRTGVLYSVTRTLADMGLDIRSAKIQTLANVVVDTFYVVGPHGSTLGEQHQREIEMELKHAL